jgi:acetyl esterase/lipase
MLRQLLAAALLVLAAGAQAQQSVSDFAWTLAPETETRANLVYAVASGQELKLDLYLPWPRSKAVPLLVHFHGGGWIAGSKEGATLHLLPYLAQGYAVATVQYRLAKVAPAPAAVEDVRCALRYLGMRAGEFKIDTQRIVVTGGSAGGHLALMAGMLPAGHRFDRGCATPEGDRWVNGKEPALKVAAIVNWFGITDVADLLAGANAKHYAIEWFGAMPDEQRALLAREVSPLSLVRRDGPPVITIHGDADLLVPYSHAQRLHEALSKAGVNNQLLTIPGGGHGAFGRENQLKAAAAIQAFLQKQGL